MGKDADGVGPVKLDQLTAAKGYVGHVEPKEHRDLTTVESGLLPGAVLGEGRYRLLAHCGRDERCDASLWRAKDGALGRDVALTILLGDAGDPEVVARTMRTLERAMHASGFVHPGAARVLDVLRPGHGVDRGGPILGIVVAEWTQGTDLIDLVSDGPLPALAAAKLLEPLVTAVDLAHHAGLVLGVDHPSRIRISQEGEARLAFPGPQPANTAAEDVRGVGAVLYMMLTGRWALPGGPASVQRAPIGPDGTVVAPRTLRPTVPLELSTVAVRSVTRPGAVAGTGDVRTAAAILRVLHQTIETHTEAERLGGQGDQPGFQTAVNAPNQNTLWRTEDPIPDVGRKRKLRYAVVALTAATLGVVTWIGLGVFDIFSGGATHVPVIASGPGGQAAGSGPDATKAGDHQADVDKVEVFDVTGTPDNPGNVNKVIDRSTGTRWSTQWYRQQLPDAKPGIGIMVTLAEAQRLATAIIDSPSPNTKVEVRAADNPTPTLEETRVIGQAVLGNGRSEIALKTDQPTQYVLVWITRLASSENDRVQTEISELTFLQAR